MVFDHASVQPNPARDKVHVKLPRSESVELEPSSAEHVATVCRLVPNAYRLPLLWLDWSGARVSTVETIRVSDYDEPEHRVRLRAAAAKIRIALWVELPDVLADALEAILGPREDGDPDAPLFPGVGADRLRTAIARACRARASRRSAPTIYATGGSACSIARGSRGRISPGLSVSARSRSPLIRTRTCSSMEPNSTTRRCSHDRRAHLVHTPVIPRRLKTAD